MTKKRIMAGDNVWVRIQASRFQGIVVSQVGQRVWVDIANPRPGGSKRATVEVDVEMIHLDLSRPTPAVKGE